MALPTRAQQVGWFVLLTLLVVWAGLRLLGRV
jgi:hypothetical protein